MSTAPYEAGVVHLPWYDVTSSLLLYVSGRSGSLTLRPTDLTVTYDASNTPRVTCEATIAWPPASTRGYLDPINFALSVSVNAGYKKKTTGIVDSHQLARLRVVKVERDWIAQTFTITAASDEAIVVDQAADATRSYTTTDTVIGAIKDVIGDAFPGESQTWDVQDSLAGLTFPAAGAHLAVGDDRWNAITDWADSIQARVFHDGSGTWVARTAPTNPGASVVTVNTGPHGTVSALTVTDDRSLWANEVVVRYTYTTGSVQHVDCGIAKTNLKPRRSLLVERDRAPVNSEATAKAILRRQLRSSHAVTLTATAAYWLRPWLTMSTRTSEGRELVLVQTVAFDLIAGQMDVTGLAPQPGHADAIATSSTTTTP